MEWYVALLLVVGGLLVLMATGMPIAVSFMLVNIIWVFLLWGGAGGLEQLVLSILDSVTIFTLLPLPLFVLMGEFCFYSLCAPHGPVHRAPFHCGHPSRNSSDNAFYAQHLSARPQESKPRASGTEDNHDRESSFSEGRVGNAGFILHCYRGYVFGGFYTHGRGRYRRFRRLCHRFCQGAS